MQETNKNTDCNGETWVAGKAEPISPRVAASLGEPMLGCNIGWTRRGVPFWEVMVRWYDGTILERSGPITTGGHSTYCGAKCSLGFTSLPRLCEPTASLRRGGGEHNLPTVKKSKADLHSGGRFVIHSEVRGSWFAWPFQLSGVSGMEINASIATLKSVKEKKLCRDKKQRIRSVWKSNFPTY